MNLPTDRRPRDASAPTTTARRPPGSAPRTLNRILGSASAVEAELDDPGRDQARPLAAGLAGDVELRGQGVEAALGGALADVQCLGDLRPGGGAAGEGALAAVGGDQGGRGRPLLLGQRDGGRVGGNGRAGRARDGRETSSR